MPFPRGDEPGQAVRLPAVAALDASLMLLRYPLSAVADQPVGTAVLRVVLDLGAALDGVERAEADLPAEVVQVRDAVLGPGVVRLHFAGREVATALVTGGHRPVVAIAGTLSVTEAMLLDQAARQDVVSPLWATAEGTIAANHPGGTVRISIAGQPDGELTAARAADWLREAVEVDGMDRRVGLAVAAAHLFQPAPSAEPWSLVPGWPAPHYRRDAMLLSRPAEPVVAGHQTLTVEPDAPLPWFAAAPVALSADAVTRHELPGSRVRTVWFMPNPAGRQVTVEVEAGGTTRTVELIDEVSLRFVPTGQDTSYRWRTAGGQWHTTDNTHTVVGQDD